MMRFRRRWLVVAAVAAVVGAVVWVVTARSPDVERSRGIRLGMTRAEVEAVMGDTAPVPIYWRDKHQLLFGKTTSVRVAWQDQLTTWLHWNPMGTHVSSWPVRVEFDDQGRVDRIERQGEPAEERGK